MCSKGNFYLEGIQTDLCAKHTTIRDLLVHILNDNDNNDRVCAIFDQNELTIGQLADGARRIAASLVSYDIIAIRMDHSLQLIVTLCGVILRGIPYVPLDPSLPLERIRYILEDSQAQLIIVDSASLLLDTVKVMTYSQLYNDVTHLDVNKTTEQTSENTFCLMYTSGSTGQPKGVYLPHRALLNRLYWQWTHFPFSEEDVYCLKTSLSFIDSIAELFAPLLRRVRMVILPKSLLLDIDRFISVLSIRRISHLVLVPSLLRVIIDHLKNNTNKSLPALRIVACSGETMSLTLIESFFSLKQCFSPTCRLLNLYGSTELMADATCEIFDSTDHSYDIFSFDGHVSVGYPLDNVRVDIVEPDEQGIGQLVISGECLANDYHKVDVTNVALANKFFRDDNGRLHFRTGDFGKIWNDRIICYGRCDNQIKIGGNRVDLSEIELVLKQHYNCREPIAVYQTTTAQIIVFLRVSEETIGLDRASLSKYLPSYAIPSRFVSVVDFPFLVSGKIDRQQLIKSLDIIHETTSVEHDLDEESAIDRAFYSALAEIGISRALSDQNFFAAGGTSLNALLLVANLHRIGFHYLTVQRLFGAKSLRDILLNRETYSNLQDYDLFFENDNDYQVIPLEQVDKRECQRILVESFADFNVLDLMVHHNIADLKRKYSCEWYTALDMIWPYYIAAGLSFGVLTSNGQLVGIALSFDEAAKTELDLSCPPKYLPVCEMVSAGTNELLEELRSNNALPQRIMHVSMVTCNPDVKPDRRLGIMYFAECELLRLAATNHFQAVITENSSGATQQLDELVLKYDINRKLRVNQYRDSSGTLVFPHVPDDITYTISIKYLVEQ